MRVNVSEGLNMSDEMIQSIQKQFNSDIRSMINYMQTNQDVHHGNLAIATDANWDEITADLKKGTSVTIKCCGFKLFTECFGITHYRWRLTGRQLRRFSWSISFLYITKREIFATKYSSFNTTKD